MDDGSTKPISDVQVGDKVIATDPETGESSAQPVTVVHNNLDTELADVTVSTKPFHAAKDETTGEGQGDRSTRGPTDPVLHTTQNHPFWDATTRSWVHAADLEPGESTLIGPKVKFSTSLKSAASSAQRRCATSRST